MNTAKLTVTGADKTPTPLQVLTVAHRSAQVGETVAVGWEDLSELICGWN
jgi:hypothetical protein